MAAVPRRSPRRAGRVLLVGVVAIGHIAAFLMASLSQPKETPPHAEPPLQSFAMLPLAPPESSPRLSPPAQPHTAREKRNKEKKPAWTALEAAAPAAPAAPAPAPAPGWTLPATGSHGPAAGELADPYAVREALRTSVGCDMEDLKLRPDEQARCADRLASQAKKARKIGPADDDPKRAAELAAEEDYQRRRHDWTTTDCGIHNSTDELDMKSALGQMPPHRGQSKDGEDEERANAC
jgi:hypothetical protein